MRGRCSARAAQGAICCCNAEPELDCADPARRARALEQARDGRRAERRSSTATASTPTCCCRSRRSPRPSGTFVNCRRPRAELPRRRASRSARRARRGRCCACSATCSACPASSTTRRRGARRRRSARRRRWRASCRNARRASRRQPRNGAPAALRAHRRRADLLRRSAGAPLAAAAADRATRSRRVRGHAPRRCSTSSGSPTATRCASRQGGGEAVLAGARRRRACRRACVRVAAAHPTTCGARARCSAPITVEQRVNGRDDRPDCNQRSGTQLRARAWPAVLDAGQDRRRSWCR